jgi:hypothetical protein
VGSGRVHLRRFNSKGDIVIAFMLLNTTVLIVRRKGMTERNIRDINELKSPIDDYSDRHEKSGPTVPIYMTMFPVRISL